MTDQPGPSRIFTADDQKAFAQASSDGNPIHLDPGFAARTQMGAPVVHGIHIALWMVGAAHRQLADLTVRNVKARFHQPLFVGENVQARLSRTANGTLRLQATAAGALLATVTLSGREAAHRSINATPFEALTEPRDVPFSQMSALSGTVAVAAQPIDLRTMFAEACSVLGVGPVKGLLGLSAIVGMACPGLHSLFAGFDIDCESGGNSEGRVAYRVAKLDQRFRSVQIEVAGSGIAGKLDAFARLPPPSQPSMADIQRSVQRKVFAGQSTLIVGGSRGLGEVTAKIVAAGGGHPVITFSNDESSARRVAKEIGEAGEQCDMVRLDVLRPIDEQLRDVPKPMHCYYFATKRIIERRGAALYDAAKARDFLAYYVEGFSNVCHWLVRGRSDGVRVFFPSTIYIDQPLPTTVEYAVAKSAGESLCRHLDEFTPNLHVLWRRLPRVLTDQTAIVGAVAAGDTLSVMLPIVHEMQARPEGGDV